MMSNAKHALVAAAMLVAARETPAQTIATRVAQAPDGVVRMQFDSRPGTCGDGRDVVGYGDVLFARNFQSIGKWHSDRCVPGPLRVTLWVDDRQVTREETQVGGAWRGTDMRVTDLGVVSSREASAYFFSLVPRLEEASGKDRVLLPAVLAADADVIEPLLAIARDENRALHTRQQAIHWLGSMGDESVVPVLATFARSDDFEGKRGRDGLSSSAMAALSNLDGGVGVPTLIDLARTGSIEIRRNAVFWLGQNGDPRGIRTLHSVIENSGEDDRVREHAIFSLGQSRDVADTELAYLIAHALDERVPMRLRRSALFWAGQRAETPTADLVRVYRDAHDTELKEHAIFVLSQRRDDEATDALLRIAREDKDRELRGKALFWLAQKHDPRVTKLISDLLR